MTTHTTRKALFAALAGALAFGGAARADEPGTAPAGAPATASGAKPAPRLVHVPPADAAPGQELPIDAQVERAWTGTLDLHYRAMGSNDWEAVPFGRIGDGDTYRATVPASVVAAPGFEYHVAGAGDGAPHFATAESPHRVLVHESRAAVLRRRELERVGSRRARARVATEWIDFGAQDPGGLILQDSYYRIDADFTYRVLRFPLYSLRFGYTRLRGDTPAIDENGDGMGDDTACELSPIATCNSTAPAGFDGGWFEARFRVTSLIELDVRGIAAATATTIHPGFRFEGRIGPEAGSHVAAGMENIADTGSSYHLRLAWDTVPALPMAATIEISDMPSENRTHGVRLVYDVAHPFESGVRFGVRVGYQAREALVGGMSGGVIAAVEF